MKLSVAVADTERPTGHGCMKGTIEIVGDIVSPIDVKWDAAE